MSTLCVHLIVNEARWTAYKKQGRYPTDKRGPVNFQTERGVHMQGPALGYISARCFNGRIPYIRAAQLLLASYRYNQTSTVQFNHGTRLGFSSPSPRGKSALRWLRWLRSRHSKTCKIANLACSDATIFMLTEHTPDYQLKLRCFRSASDEQDVF